MRPLNTRLLLHLLFVLALLAGQQAALAHALTHLPVASQSGLPDGPSHGGGACEDCVAHASLGLGLPLASSLPVGDASAVLAGDPLLDCVSPGVASAYLARAPPAYLL